MDKQLEAELRELHAVVSDQQKRLDALALENERLRRELEATELVEDRACRGSHVAEDAEAVAHIDVAHTDVARDAEPSTSQASVLQQSVSFLLSKKSQSNYIS